MSAPLEQAVDVSKGPPAPEFSGREFRDMLGLFPTGVAVVTAIGADGVRLGATVSSFSSVSLDPPLVLFSLSRSAKAFAAWRDVPTFAVNILSEEQSALSTRFARALSDKWVGVEVRTGRNGDPLLQGVLVTLECTSYARYPGGDHLIIVGRVDALARRQSARARPLVFFSGQYRRIDPEQQMSTPPAAEGWLHGW